MTKQNKAQPQQPAPQLTESSQIQASKQARSNQSSVQTVIPLGLSPPQGKKRNIRAQMSTQMNKTTSLNEMKKISSKTATATNLGSITTKKAQDFYKAMMKPGAISSQSFIHASEHSGPSIKTTSAAGKQQAQTPRDIMMSPATVAQIKASITLQKNSLQKTQTESKNESSAVGSSSIIHQTPQSKIKGSNNKTARQSSYKEKDGAFQVSKFKSDLAPPNIGQGSPSTRKLAPSKGFQGGSGAKSSAILSLDVSPKNKAKKLRSRNAVTDGKQTVDNAYKSTKNIENKQFTLTLKNTELEYSNAISNKRGVSGKRVDTKNSSSTQNRQDSEEYENFDTKDLDEKEPCQTYATNNISIVGAGATDEKKARTIMPLKTRSTHSLTINNLQKKTTIDLNRTNSIQNEEDSNQLHQQTVKAQRYHNSGLTNLTNHPNNQRLHTQTQIKYRNESMKLPFQQPSFQKHSLQNLNNQEYQTVSTIQAENHNIIGEQLCTETAILKTAGLMGLALPTQSSTSDLENISRKQQQIGVPTMTQQSIRDFLLEDHHVIKEEKPRSIKKGQFQSGNFTTKNNLRTKNGQLNFIARDFAIQSSGQQSAKVLNMPPKPSRNAKNSTLVLGNSTGVPTRSMQSIVLSKAKHLNQQQQTIALTTTNKRSEVFTPNNLFKGALQQLSKADKQVHQSEQAKGPKNNSSLKDSGKQMRYLNKAAADKIHAHLNQQQSSSPIKKAINQESVKKVSKIASQDDLNSGVSQAHQAQQLHQYSMSMIQKASLEAQKMMTSTPILNSLHKTAEKKQSKHLFMSLTKPDKSSQNKASGGVSRREMSISNDQLRQQQSMQKVQGKSAQRYSDQTIEFDHLQRYYEDSHTNPSQDLEEQPTVVYVDDIGQNIPQISSAEAAMGKLKQHMVPQKQNSHSKERNLSLLNSSAIQRDKVQRPQTRSVSSQIEEQQQLPKLVGKTGMDSKLFRQQLAQQMQNQISAPDQAITGLKQVSSDSRKISNKASIIKLKQATAPSSGPSMTASQTQTVLVSQQPSCTSSVHVPAMMMQYSLQPHQLMHNKSLVSSQASLHHVPSAASTLSHQKQQKLLKATTNAVQQPLCGSGNSSECQQIKKTTKKSMIKQ